MRRWFLANRCRGVRLAAVEVNAVCRSVGLPEWIVGKRRQFT
jgi:hypothetical protein